MTVASTEKGLGTAAKGGQREAKHGKGLQEEEVENGTLKDKLETEGF